MAVIIAHFESAKVPGRALCGQASTTLSPCPACQRVLVALMKVHVLEPHTLVAYCGVKPRLPVVYLRAAGGVITDAIEQRFVARERALEVTQIAEANPGLIEPCFCDTCATKADRALDDEARGWAPVPEAWACPTDDDEAPWP